MSPRPRHLVERLKRRASEDGSQVAASRPASERAVDTAERQIQFQLPELLRAVYTQIGNGGFGPGYGIVGLAGGARPEGKSLAQQYRAQRSLARMNRHWHWPEGLLPLCSLGCGMWSCLDCVEPRTPVYLFEPNNLDAEETDEHEAVLQWTNAFWHEAPSFAAWLERWLNGRDEPEPTW